jgi:hypothetical protein
MRPTTAPIHPVYRFDLVDERGRRFGGLVTNRADWLPGQTLTLSVGQVEIVHFLQAARRSPDEPGSLVVRHLSTPNRRRPLRQRKR